MERQTELDWLRGLMLVLMTITHLPTWFSSHVGPAVRIRVGGRRLRLPVGVSRRLRLQAQGAHARLSRRCAARCGGARSRSTPRTSRCCCSCCCVLVPIAVSPRRACDHRSRVVLPRASASRAGERPRARVQPAAARHPADVRAVPAAVAARARAMASRRGWGALLALSAVLWLFAQYDGGRARLRIGRGARRMAGAVRRRPAPFRFAGVAVAVARRPARSARLAARSRADATAARARGRARALAALRRSPPRSSCGATSSGQMPFGVRRRAERAVRQVASRPAAAAELRGAGASSSCTARPHARRMGPRTRRSPRSAARR